MDAEEAYEAMLAAEREKMAAAAGGDATPADTPAKTAPQTPAAGPSTAAAADATGVSDVMISIASNIVYAWVFLSVKSEHLFRSFYCTHTNFWGSLTGHLQWPGWQPTLHMTWCLIWWLPSIRKS